MAAARPERPERPRRDAPAAGRPAAAVLPGLASELRGLADQPDALAPAQAVGELAPHQHEPGILRDTVMCPACAAAVPSPAEGDAPPGRRTP